MNDAPETVFALPPALISRADLARLAREVEVLDNELGSQKVRGRETGDTTYHMPAMSQSLHDFVELNKLDLNDDRGRMLLKENLLKLKDKAPIMHMTFAVEADPEFLGKLVAWVRQEVHPQALISVGLQPSLVGGVYVRTPNHVHDFSMKSLLASKRDVMIKQLEGLRRG